MTNPNDPHNTNTVREVHTERRSSRSMAFIVGGLVVAVLVIGWVLFSGGGEPEGDVEDAADEAAGAIEDAGEAVENAADQAGEAVEGAAEE